METAYEPRVDLSRVDELIKYGNELVGILSDFPEKAYYHSEPAHAICLGAWNCDALEYLLVESKRLLDKEPALPMPQKGNIGELWCKARVLNQRINPLVKDLFRR